MVETHIKILTSSHELPRKRAYTSSMHRRSLHTMGLHTTQNTKSKMGLRGKLCFILHFLFLCPHLDFFVTSSISPKPKVLILCVTCFMDDFSVCTNCVCFQVKKTRTLKGKHCIKNQGQKPIHQKYKTNESTNRHKPKKKWKQTINKKKGKTLCK
jgi:hypothetical protein